MVGSKILKHIQVVELSAFWLLWRKLPFWSQTIFSSSQTFHSLGCLLLMETKMPLSSGFNTFHTHVHQVHYFLSRRRILTDFCDFWHIITYKEFSFRGLCRETWYKIWLCIVHKWINRYLLQVFTNTNQMTSHRGTVTTKSLLVVLCAKHDLFDLTTYQSTPIFSTLSDNKYAYLNILGHCVLHNANAT